MVLDVCFCLGFYDYIAGVARTCSQMHSIGSTGQLVHSSPAGDSFGVPDEGKAKALRKGLP